MPDYFIGVFKSGDIIKKDDLTELKSIPHITHFFKMHSYRRHETPLGYVSHYWTYTPINVDGTKRILQAGKFEIIDIGHEDGFRDSLGRIITISENQGEKVHTYRSLTSGSGFIRKDLFPLIEKLTALGSWEIFTDLEQLKQSKNQIERLNELVNKQKKEIQELKKEIENLKSLPN